MQSPRVTDLWDPGLRWWRMRYFVDGLEKTLSVGVYPEISLKRAREPRQEIRSQVANGSNPSDERKAQRRGREQTFELVAREWWEKRRHLWKDEYAQVILTRFSQDIFPYIGKRPVAKLEAPDFLECLERMQKRGVLETAHKVKTKCSEVMRYAVATRRAPRDPLVDLRGALPPVRVQHYASITFPSEVGALLRAIDGYQGKSRVVQAALLLNSFTRVLCPIISWSSWVVYCSQWPLRRGTNVQNSEH